LYCICMTSPEGSFDEYPLESLEHEHDPTTLREVLQMLEEMKADEHSVLAIIEEVLTDPIPDPNDSEAVAQFREKMKVVRAAAEAQLARSDLLNDIERRIEDKLAQAEDPS
jgi:hypothetical protein